MTTDLVYSPIPGDRSGEVADFLLGTFFIHEPLGNAVEMPVSQVSRWLPAFVDKAVKQNASIMAVDPDNKIIGVSVNLLNVEDMDMEPFLDRALEPKMWMISKFLDQLNADLETPNKAERILSTMFLSVDARYGGKGIANQLALKSIELGQGLGIDSFEVSTTSEFSYKVYKKLGYDIIREQNYADFVYEGVKVMDGVDLGVHQKARVLYKIVKL